MTEFLVVRLPGEDTQPVNWIVVDDVGEPLALPESGSLDDAATRAAQRKVVMLVPPQQVLRTNAVLPVKGQARMLQAIPFALEEHLATDVADMHFAIGERDSDGKVAVAAADKGSMTAWIDGFASAGLQPSRIYSEAAGLPRHDGFSVVADDQRCLIRDPQGNYLGGTVAETAALLRIMGAGPEIDDEDNGAYLAESTPGINALVSELRLLLPELKVHTLPQGTLPVLAKTVVTSPGIDLMQGEFASSGQSSKYWHAWRRVAGLAALLAVVTLGAKTVELVALRSEAASLAEQINVVAADALPPNSRLVNPVVQLEQLAAQLGSGGSDKDNEFVEMLASLAAALNETNTAAVGKLDYRNGTMDLTLTAPDVETLDRIRAGVARTGLVAQIQSTNVIDVGVQGRLRISGERS